MKLFSSFILLMVTLKTIVWCSPPSSDHRWHGSKDEYQQHLIDKTQPVRGKRFEVGTIRWQKSATTLERFTGPWTEERFFDFWMLEQPQIERVYLPIQWTGNELIDNLHWREVNDVFISDLLQSLDKTYKYFTVIQIANAFENTISDWTVPADLDLTVYSTGPTVTGSRVVPIPLLKEVLKPQGLAKSMSVTFYGDTGPPVRKALHAMYVDDPLFTFMTHHKDWISGTEQSNFTLAPRGWGHDSFRRWEALQLGTIPVYIHDSPQPWLPYKELIDWDILSVNVHADHIDQIAITIKKLQSSGKVPAMHEAIKKCKRFFTYEFMLSYILQDLKEFH